MQALIRKEKTYDPTCPTDNTLSFQGTKENENDRFPE
jgi:hypothetical protein